MSDVTVSSLGSDSRVSPRDGVLACDLAGGAALLDTASGTYFALNGVGAAIWTLIEQSNTIAALQKHITATFEVTDARAGQDLHDLIASLAEHGLVRIERR